jgi:hypothetical protein
MKNEHIAIVILVLSLAVFSFSAYMAGMILL